eukprot:SAG31_NODE_3545_length_4140_cov_1.821579_1_plen_470_part_00
MSIKLVVFATFWQRMVLTIGTKLGHLLGSHWQFFYQYNFMNFWIEILGNSFNSLEYFVSKGSDYDDGQTNHGCNCVGYQSLADLQSEGPKFGFMYGNETFGQVWGEPKTDNQTQYGATESIQHGFNQTRYPYENKGQYCCNGIVKPSASQTSYEDLVSADFLTDNDTFCNFNMKSNQSVDFNGGFNALWCPVNISSCFDYRKGNTADLEWIKRHFLDADQKKHMYFDGNQGGTWWNGTDFSDWAIKEFENHSLPPKIYWDFCDSSFNDKLTMNDQDVSTDDPIFSELCIRGSQAMLVCFEMFLAAWAHRKVFSYEPYKAAANKSFLQALIEIISPADIVSDVSELGAAVVPDAVKNVVDSSTKTVSNASMSVVGTGLAVVGSVGEGFNSASSTLVGGTSNSIRKISVLSGIARTSSSDLSSPERPNTSRTSRTPRTSDDADGVFTDHAAAENTRGTAGNIYDDEESLGT